MHGVTHIKETNMLYKFLGFCNGVNEISILLEYETPAQI
jgi:hypothetical protein